MEHKIITHLNQIKDEIKAIYQHYFLVPKPVKIIAVSKNQPVEHILPLLEAGHRIFGENKVTEALEKWPSLKVQYPDVELHMIGHLQSNKVKKALSIFDVFQTIDRPSLVDEMLKYKTLLAHKKFFIQVNIAAEPQKSGVLKDDFAEIMTYCTRHNLSISGLMCIPPQITSQSIHGLYYFTQLQSMARQYGHLKISAGMSNDFAKAIIAGTDYVRIGTRIFGTRNI